MPNPPELPSSESFSPRVPAVLGRCRARVLELTDTLWAAHDSAELMDTVAEIESLKSTLDSLELDLVRELEDTQAVKQVGWASTQDFVTSVAGGRKGHGPGVVRLAQATARSALAPVGEAMRDGWLSTTKAHVIERAVDALPGDPELRARGTQFLLAEAKRLDATDLRMVAAHLVTVVDPDGDERRAEKALDRLERAAHRNRFLSIGDDEAGGAWIKGRCSSEDAAIIKTTLLPLSAPQPTSASTCDPDTCEERGCLHDGRDPRDHGARMLDAWVEACGLLQGAEVLPESHGATPRLNLTMSLQQLHRITGYATTDTGQDVSASAARRICCDAQVIPIVLGGSSEVLDVGRAQRLVTTAIWRALVVRDRHCQFPGCTRPPVMCHAHHVEHWMDGGPTSLVNLVLLCGHHHRLVHAGPWTIRVLPDGTFAFDPPPGRFSHGPPGSG